MSESIHFIGLNVHKESVGVESVAVSVRWQGWRCDHSARVPGGPRLGSGGSGGRRHSLCFGRMAAFFRRAATPKIPLLTERENQFVFASTTMSRLRR